MKRKSGIATARKRPVVRRTAVAQAVTAAIAATALAAPAAGQEIEEVIVSATKRDESVQDVPLAITALTGDFTKSANLNDVKDLVSFTPGVSGNSQDSFIDAISMRGIRTQDFGVGGDPSAAFFKNDLYEGRNGAVVTSLYDMERSEIVNGPQGFLFGRNSIGGAFSVYTRKAEIGASDGYWELDGAERGHLIGEGAFNFPMSDKFAVRLAGYMAQEDGFADNDFDGDPLIQYRKYAMRLSTTYENGPWSVNTELEYEDREQSGSVYRAVDRGDIWDSIETALGPIEISPDEERINSDQSGGDADDSRILTLGVHFDYDWDTLTLTSNTGFKDHDYFYSEDYDGTPLNINNYAQDQEGDYFQQEFRLTSNTESAFSWYAGMSYYKENVDAFFKFSGEEDFMCQYYGYYYNGITFDGCLDLYNYYGSPFSPSPDGLLTETGRIIGDYSGWAAYVDLNFAVSDSFDIGIGARYSNDDKDFSINVPTPTSDLGPYFSYTFSTDGAITDSQDWSDTQLRAMGRYRPTDTAIVYVSYTEGFKSGGFGSFGLNDAMGNAVGGGLVGASRASGFVPDVFQPETVDSYEIGYKDTWNGRTNVALTGFFYEYEGLQVVVGDGGASSVENVGQVDGVGVEASLNTRLSDNYSLYLAASWLDTEATQLQSICGLANPAGCEGSELFWAPEITAAAVVSGTWPTPRGRLVGALEAYYESERGGGFENLSSTMIDAYTDITVRFGFESNDNWTVKVYGENLTDEFTWDGLNNNGGLLPSHFFGPKRPRTFGITFGYSWE